MVANRNAVFKFVLDIRQYLQKGRQVVQTNNMITGSTQKSSQSMDRLSSSTQRAGQSATAAAVNFQTMTQGMLNLSTAGIQTFTSFSNLDRAGNRLAQAHIGVARAQDLLNNKQLRLNDLQAKGLGQTQKAALLTNELATARADLAVKTDKAKIEEGALFDIQLLFVANIANVMIASLQTIRTLRELHVASTIKQIVQEKLLATTIFTKSVPAQAVQIGAMKTYIVTAKSVVNVNRLLAIGIPVIGAAIVGVSLAYEAWTENIGGFRDAITSVLPFLEDKKALLRDVQGELQGVNNDWQDLTSGMESATKRQIGLAEQWALRIKLANLQVQEELRTSREAMIRTGFSPPINKVGGLNGTKLPITAGHFLLGAPSVLHLLGLTDPAPIHLQREKATLVSPITGQPTASPTIPHIPTRAEIIAATTAQSGLQTIRDPVTGNITTRRVDAEGFPVLTSRFIGNPSFEFNKIQDPRINNDFYQILSTKYPQAFNGRITREPALLGGEIFLTEEAIDNLKKNGTGSARDQAELAVLQQQLVRQKDVMSKISSSSKVKIFQGDRFFQSTSEFTANPNVSPFLQTGDPLLQGTGSVLTVPGTGRKVAFGGFGGEQIAQRALDGGSFRRGNRVDPNMFIEDLLHQQGQDFLANGAKVPKGHRTNVDVTMLINKGDGRATQTAFLGSGVSALSFSNNPSVRMPAWVKQQQNIQLENMRRLRYGGTRQLDESGFALPLSISGAVTGGFTSISAFRADARQQLFKQSTGAIISLGTNFGIFTALSSSPSVANAQRARAITTAQNISSSLASAGLTQSISYVGARKVLRGGRYADPTGLQYQARVTAVRLANQELMARATGINLLNGGFGLPEFIGSGLSSVSLSDEIAKQDALIDSIGLNRTEAFKIIDTLGRGRTEIDERVLWTQRNGSISTGVAII